MKVRTVFGMIALLAVLVLLVTKDTPAGEKKDPFAEYLAKYGTPGPEHTLLKSMEGTWHVKVKMYMEPGKPPSESEGTSVRSMILEGRYLQDKFEGSFFGQKFEGIGVMAFDRFKKSYSMTWIDSMGTGVMNSTGTYDAKTKTFTFTSPEDVDPISGKKMKMRDTLRIVSDKQHLLEMYRVAPGEPEFKVMEISYTRKK